MTQINLLPWREELRKEKRQEFLAVVVGMLVLGGVLIFAVNYFIDSKISSQNGRNQFLSGEISKLDNKIGEIKDLQKRRDQLVDRMKVIQALQGNRPVVVHILDELTRTIPDGVHYTKASKSGVSLRLEGVAETNNNISKLMRNLDESPWFKNPNLATVNNVVVQGVAMNKFILSVGQIMPDLDLDKEPN